jgi:hypothetical protein
LGALQKWVRQMHQKFLWGKFERTGVFACPNHPK